MLQTGLQTSNTGRQKVQLNTCVFSVSIHILSAQNSKNCNHQTRFCAPKYTEMLLQAVPLGSLRLSPDSSLNLGAASRQLGEEEGTENEWKKKGKTRTEGQSLLSKWANAVNPPMSYSTISCLLFLSCLLYFTEIK